MQLSILQSRLVASLVASLLVLVLYLFLFGPNLAQAAEVHGRTVVYIDEPLEARSDLDLEYEPDFPLFDRGIVGRAPPGVFALTNNVPMSMNLNPGSTECFMVEGSSILRRDVDGDDHGLESRSQSWKTLYLSANTCLQPELTKPDATTPSPPQLTVFVSNSSDITCPDASSKQTLVSSKAFDEGAVMYKINATGDIYIGVSVPNITTNYSGTYNFEIAASLNEYYHRYDGGDNSELLWMDSDSSSVLLVTRNITQDYSRIQQVMNAGPPYELFVQNSDSGSIDGLQHSVCGLENNAQISANRNGDGKLNNLVQTGMTTRGPGSLPKQQFYFMGLNSSSTYEGILVKTANGTASAKRSTSAGGGGIVYKATQFQTLSGTNCKVVTDLDFCDEIQYAVPGNDGKYNNTALAKVYDDYAKQMYANFEKVMQQIPCEAPADSRYSLARNCSDCMSAYKQWLCTVSIPRCEDILSNSTFALARNLGQAFPNGTQISESLKQEIGVTPWTNTSRNAFIDQTIQPGPYKEILPCDDICYQVVQSCPAAIGFVCPQPRMHSFNASYGRRDADNDAVTCNYPGEARTITGAAHFVRPARFILGLVPLVMCWLI